jgi:hypothetical protein
MTTDASGRHVAPDQRDPAPAPARHGELGILGLCWRCGCGLTVTDAAAGHCTQCGADCVIRPTRPPCPQCGGRTRRGRGTVEETVTTGGGRLRRVGRPAAWDECTACEWAEEGRL